jgi:hypothetical protein
LRIHNPDVYVILLLDKKTKDSLVGTRSSYEKLISEIKVIDAPQNLSKKAVSRWLKTTMRRHVQGDFLYIDCDTIISDRLDISFSPDIKIGAVLDAHVPFSKHQLYNTEKKEIDTLLGFSTTKYDKYFNGGAVFCRDIDIVHNFFSRWNFLWSETTKKNLYVDQPSFNQSNIDFNNIITEISGTWNCQIVQNGLPYLYNAKVIHYFATSHDVFLHPYLLASSSILSKIKETGSLSPNIVSLLNKAKGTFTTNSRIIADQRIFDILDSSYFSKLFWLREKFPKVFSKLNFFLALIKRSDKKKHRKQTCQKNH